MDTVLNQDHCYFNPSHAEFHVAFTEHPTPDLMYAVDPHPVERPLVPPAQAGYILILDNLDCYIKVRNMTAEHQNKLTHYVNVSTVMCLNIIYRYILPLFISLIYMQSFKTLLVLCAI
jgi:hypothetical protein